MSNTGSDHPDRTSDPNPNTPQAILQKYFDEYDYQIFRLLNNNGRISDTELAEQIGLSRTAVRRRREKLQDSDILEILAVIVLQEANLADADILVKFDQQGSSENRDQFIEKLIDEELIYRVNSCMGEYDLLFSLWHSTLNDLKEYLWELFDGEDAVKEYSVVPLVKTWKAWNKELNRP
ncbi:Lrp/AsnC family transcriptional regulator [Haladaptatus sp. CMSO5]|uniref:Lrp/AsnC family transcriptional regulator n=1 Tax=Haladaptatus sp. CMSO5 TaxID=3120514 RepID=UPI002FCE42BD